VAAAFLLCDRKVRNKLTYIDMAKSLDIAPTYIASDRLAIDLARSAEADILGARVKTERSIERGK
jgi:hypothetical protein